MKTSYQNTSMQDMIFEHRNKAYGAYVLRTEYNHTLRQAMFIMVTFVFLVCAGKFLADKTGSRLAIAVAPEELLDTTSLIDYTTKLEERQEKKPPVTSESQPVPTQHNTEMQVVENDNVIDSVPTVDELLDIAPGLTTNLNANPVGVTDGQGTEATFEVAAADRIDTVVRIPEVWPVFPGGEAALLKFIAKHTDYPPRALEIGEGGRVIAEFTVNTDGKPIDIKIIKSPGPDFDREVIRVIKMLPAFKPGMQSNRPVKVRYTVPVNFRAEDF